jgi:hypothetical protein
MKTFNEYETLANFNAWSGAKDTKETILITKLSDGQNLVGKKKTSNWKLPPIDFVYGKKEKEDAEGVSRSKLF